MPTNCCVLGCFDRGKYSLPLKCPAIWKNWIKACPYLQCYNIRELDCKRICSKHFIPEHFDIKRNLLSENAVPMLNLPKVTSILKTTNDNSEVVTQTNEETDEGIQIIEDYIDPSLYSSSNVDESSHYDTEECIPLTFKKEEIECDPLQMTPKQSPIDYDGYEESVCDYSPPPDPIPLNHPPEFIEHTANSGSPIIKPQPIKVPRVVLHRLPTISKNCKVVLLPHTGPNPDLTKQDDGQTPHKKIKFDLPTQVASPGHVQKLTKHIIYKQLSKPSRWSNTNSQYLCMKIRSHLQEYHLLKTFGKMLSTSQIRLTGTFCDGARYTTKEKIFALSMAKQTRKGYDFMREQLALPSENSINSMLNDIPLRPGINEFIFQYLSDAAVNKTAKEKECALLFSEMKIDKYVKFNARTGIVEGFQDLGAGKRANNVGDKVLVFMLCGLFQLWKLPIAYYITGDITDRNNNIYQKILIEIVMAVFETGFLVKATVSDHSPKNVEAINSFLADSCNSEDNIYYEIDDACIFHIYDVTNIMESLKSDAINDNRNKSDDHAKWNFFETLFQIDSQKGDETFTENSQGKSKATRQAIDRSTEFWDSALSKLNSMKYDFQDQQTKPLPINLFINNVKTTKKVWEELRAARCAYVRRLNLKPLNFLFRKFKENTSNKINSNQFIIAYRNNLINNLISCKSLNTITAGNYFNKVLFLIKNFTNAKKYGPYNDDVDLENIIYFTGRISSGLPVSKAVGTYFVSNMPYKDCIKCRQSITPDQNMNKAIWKSSCVIDELLPHMVNIHVYPLILILQREVETSWFTCTVHKDLFYRILWIFLIKCRAKNWCTYHNNQKGYYKPIYFIPTE